jgi:hypothetical protein
MATIIYPDGQEEPTEPANGQYSSLAELQKIVEGMIEIVPCRDGRIMVANEESKILELERNDKATALADLPTPAERNAAIADMRRQGITVINIMGLDEEDYIAGTVLVCKNSEDGLDRPLSCSIGHKLDNNWTIKKCCNLACHSTLDSSPQKPLGLLDYYTKAES